MKKLIYFGLLSPLFYLLGDILGGLLIPEYNWITITVSEIIEAGSPVGFVSVFFFLSAIFAIIFGIGIFLNFKEKLLKIGGILIIILGIFSALSSSIFPVDPMGAEITFAGSMHLMLVGLSVLGSIVAMLVVGVGMFKKEKKCFLAYSIITLLVMFVFGILSGVAIANSWEVLGLFERIAVYAYQLWIVILVFKLLKMST